MRSEWGRMEKKMVKESSRILREAAGASFGCRPGCYPFWGGAARHFGPLASSTSKRRVN